MPHDVSDVTTHLGMILLPRG